jgi:hypothetical protein
LVSQEELKAKEQSFATERQQLSSARQGQEVERLTERLKDKDEAVVRLQIEVQSLRVSHFNSLMKTGLNKTSLIMPVHCICNLKQFCLKVISFRGGMAWSGKWLTAGWTDGFEILAVLVFSSLPPHSNVKGLTSLVSERYAGALTLYQIIRLTTHLYLVLRLRMHGA